MSALSIKAFITDIDGTLTNGSYYVSCDGCVQKKYNTRDFYNMRLLKERGIKVFVVTSSNDDCDYFRMKSVGIKLFQDVKNKKEFLENNILKNNNLSWCDIFYVGDYPNDLECIKMSGISACPFDAHDSIKNVDENMVLSSNGGDACVAEAIDWYLGVL
tara:strand:+ start:1779 stop:2255 length:477 start_codon:yes stop_codon:yes gene_type:complete